MTPIVNFIQNLRNDRFLTKIDISRGYWQVPVAPVNIHKTVFSTPNGVYEFLRMPFGIVNSGATLTTAIRKLLRGMRNLEHYVDEILVYTATSDCHVATLRELLRQLAKSNLQSDHLRLLLGQKKLLSAIKSVAELVHHLKRTFER